MKNLTNEITFRRKAFLSELRSGKYKKGTIKSDEKGYPVFEKESDKEGSCACAIMVEMYGGIKSSPSLAMKALGLSSKECRYIQQEINDTPDDFNLIADRIEQELFNR